MTDTPTTPAPDAPAPTNAFLAFLEIAEDGVLRTDLDRELRSLIQVLRKHAHARNSAAAGAITLTIAMTHDTRQLHTEATISVKEPKQRRMATTVFALRDGTVQAMPRQEEMFAAGSMGTPPGRSLDDVIPTATEARPAPVPVATEARPIAVVR